MSLVLLSAYFLNVFYEQINDDDDDVNDVKFTLIPVNVGLLQIIT